MIDHEHSGNGPDHPSAASGATSGRMRTHVERIQGEARGLRDAIQGATADFERSLREQCTLRPYQTLTVAAAAGYVLGGGLASRLTVMMLDVAAKLTMAVAAREMSTALSGASVSNGERGKF